MLARLANDTGGRTTRQTNDLSLAYARAERDQSCRYTIGFYTEKGAEDLARQMKVHVTRPGMQVLSPSMFMFRSEQQKKTSRLSAAFFDPESFSQGLLRAYVFKLQPRSAREWDVLIAVSFPIRFEDLDNPEATYDFGGTLIAGPKIAHEFNRRGSIRPRDPSLLRERRFMFLEPATIEPGEYTLSIVVAGTDEGAFLDTSRITVEIPKVRRKDLELVPPILGRPRDKNVVVRGDGPTRGRRHHNQEQLATHDVVAAKGSFEPMIVQMAEELDALLTRNKACTLGRGGPRKATIERSVLEEDEDRVRLADVPVELQRQNRASCQNIFEALSGNILNPGDYEFEILVEVQDEEQPGKLLPFAVQTDDVDRAEGTADTPRFRDR